MGLFERCVRLPYCPEANQLITFVNRLQTPVYALYPIPTIACAALHLAVRHAGIPLPGDCPSKITTTPTPADNAPTTPTEDNTLSREQQLRRTLELRQQETRESEEEAPWYTLFDVEQEDLESVVGWIMRLYQRQNPKLDETVLELVVGGKKAVRSWIDDHPGAS